MPRNTNLDEILFPVELCDVFAEVSVVFVQRPLLDDSLEVRPVMVRVPRHRAVVNTKTGETLSVVSKDYRLVTNREALDLAGQCFKKVFDTVDLKKMEVFNIIAPKSKAFCHIDIIHKGYEVNVWNKEVWLPYLRLTNSYNGSRALCFDLGFSRKLCDNGVIYERETIRYRLVHTEQGMEPVTEFHVSGGRLKKLEERFAENMAWLGCYHVPQELALPFMSRVLGLRFALGSSDGRKHERERRRLAMFTERAWLLIQGYFRDLGPNAYALLAVMSDFASHPFVCRTQSVSANALQSRVGSWIDSFQEEAERDRFDLAAYLGDYLTMFQVGTA